jgi:hypothetical protein
VFLTLPCSGVEVDVAQQEGVSGTGGRAGGIEGKGFEWVEEGFGMAFDLPGHGDDAGAVGTNGPGFGYLDGTGRHQFGGVDAGAGFEPSLNLDLNFDLGNNAFQYHVPQPSSTFPSVGSDPSLGSEFGLGLDGMDRLGPSNPLDDLSFFGDEADGYGLIGGGGYVAGDPQGIMVDR